MPILDLYVHLSCLYALAKMCIFEHSLLALAISKFLVLAFCKLLKAIEQIVLYVCVRESLDWFIIH